MGPIHACSRPSICVSSAPAVALNSGHGCRRLTSGVERHVVGRLADEVRRRPLAHKEKRRGRGELALRRLATFCQLKIGGIDNPIGISQAALALNTLEVDVGGKGFMS